ncbi:MAG: ABC transporter, partial [Prochlorothrix sp.]
PAPAETASDSAETASADPNAAESGSETAATPETRPEEATPEEAANTGTAETAEPTDDPEPAATEPRLVVIGNANFVANGIFSQQLNGDVFTNAVIWLSQRENEVLSIAPKDPTNRRIEMSAVQTNFVGWLAVLIMPLLGFSLCASLWWRRR